MFLVFLGKVFDFLRIHKQSPDFPYNTRITSLGTFGALIHLEFIFYLKIGSANCPPID